MTRQLYYEDTYQKEFDAVVTRCEKGEDGYHLYLNQSAFFPEGGGQDGDRGFLLLNAEDTRVKDAKIEVRDTRQDPESLDEDIYVVAGKAVKPGEKVHGVLDWKFRFDRMQNHSGEHIVSGIIHRRYGYQNVGFHMSEGRMTIDVSGEIPDEELKEVERQANEIVWSNAVVRTDVYTEKEAEKVEFRSKKELHGTIRVVTIPGADVCACCGTHVSRTGEIGSIRLISHQRDRGGTRIEMMCGRWAYEYMSAVFAQNHEVSSLVSARPLQTAQAVRKVLDAENDLKYRIYQEHLRSIDKTASDLAGKGPVLLFADKYDPVLVQKLTAKVMEKSGGPVWSFSGSDESSYFYAAGEKDGNLKEFVRDMNQELNGRGGGRPYFQQGSLRAGREEIIKFLKRKVPGLIVVEV